MQEPVAPIKRPDLFNLRGACQQELLAADDVTAFFRGRGAELKEGLLDRQGTARAQCSGARAEQLARFEQLARRAFGLCQNPQAPPENGLELNDLLVVLMAAPNARFNLSKGEGREQTT